MLNLKCQRCGADVPAPDLPANVKKDISGLAHRIGRLQAVLTLRDTMPLDLGDVKAIAFHLSSEGKLDASGGCVSLKFFLAFNVDRRRAAASTQTLYAF
jgi:hypothetical protein